MKIICKKDNDVKQMLELAKNFLEETSMDYPILKEDLVLEFSLKDKDGRDYLKNDTVLQFDETDLQNLESDIGILEYYYNNDTLTHLYNRGKYERDIAKFQADNLSDFICVYIDAIGLHEINNHLGHAAGDDMLCCIADGIRQYFPDSSAYRIGGDEFVIFCFEHRKAAVQQEISNLRELLNQKEYEISVGIENIRDNKDFISTINNAEYAMRCDKKIFYSKDGKKRQMRTLNQKLEKLLLEKADANHFLNVIAPEYKGVYMVNPVEDTCRYIYIPEYFESILTKNDGVFSISIRQYCNTYLCEEDQKRFQKVLDYDYVLQQLKKDNQIEFAYRKTDGSRVYLQIMFYHTDISNHNEMLWIFRHVNNE